VLSIALIYREQADRSARGSAGAGWRVVRTELLSKGCDRIHPRVVGYNVIT